MASYNVRRKWIMEQTLLIIKPDAVQRRLIGKIITRLEEKGLRLAALRMVWADRDLAERLYSVHVEKPFYGALVEFITRGPILAVVVAGPGAVAIVRKLMGATFGSQAEPGTLRGDFAMSTRYNVVHGSDSVESAAREIGLFFGPDDIIDYDLDDRRWIDTSATA
jgi:nucleoside-diphosphate kinase